MKPNDFVRGKLPICPQRFRPLMTPTSDWGVGDCRNAPSSPTALSTTASVVEVSTSLPHRACRVVAGRSGPAPMSRSAAVASPDRLSCGAERQRHRLPLCGLRTRCVSRHCPAALPKSLGCAHRLQTADFLRAVPPRTRTCQSRPGRSARSSARMCCVAASNWLLARNAMLNVIVSTFPFCGLAEVSLAMLFKSASGNSRRLAFAPEQTDNKIKAKSKRWVMGGPSVGNGEARVYAYRTQLRARKRRTMAGLGLDENCCAPRPRHDRS